LSLNRERSFVTNNPAAGKALSASTDVGGMVSKAEWSVKQGCACSSGGGKDH